MVVTIEQDHLGEFEVSKRVNGGPAEGTLRFIEPEDAFSMADSMVPDDIVKLMLANSRWRKIDPTEAQCGLLWKIDPVIRQRFSVGEAFYRFACYQFDHGNLAFSRGGMSQRIEMVKKAKEKK
jgi:hypothetical protein